MLTAFVRGDDRVIARFQQITPCVLDEIRKTTEILAIDLAAYVQRNKLSGQVLKNRTGRLRRSITYEVLSSATGSVGTVGTNVEYAHIHEYGFQGTVDVREHLRMQKMAWGKPMKDPREVTVKAHTMKMNVPGKRFLRDSMAENADKIRSGYEQAMQRGLR